MRDPEQVKTLVHKALEQYGAIDVWSTMQVYTSDQSSSPQRLASGCRHQFLGYVHTIQALLPHFLERKELSLI